MFCGVYNCLTRSHIDNVMVVKIKKEFLSEKNILGRMEQKQVFSLFSRGLV